MVPGPDIEAVPVDQSVGAIEIDTLIIARRTVDDGSASELGIEAATLRQLGENCWAGGANEGSKGKQSQTFA